MKLSIIVPLTKYSNYEADIVRDGFNSLFRQSIGTDSIEIIASVDANCAELKTVIEEYQVCYPEILCCADIKDDEYQFLATELAMATGEYAVLFDPQNSWAETSLELACKYMEANPSATDICLCREVFQKRNSDKSTFHFMYKKGNQSVDVSKNPRFTAVSVNNVIFRTRVLRETVTKLLPLIQRGQYGWDVLLLANILIQNPKMTINSEAVFNYRGGDRLSCQKLSKAEQYLSDLNLIFSEFDSIADANPAMEDYIRNLQLHEMRQYIEGTNVDGSFSKEEQLEYTRLLRDTLKKIEDSKINKAPGTVWYQRTGIFFLKYGNKLFDDESIKKDAVFSQKCKLVSLKHSTFHICTVDICNEKGTDLLRIEGHIVAWSATQKPSMYVRCDDQKTYEAEIIPYPQSGIQNRFDEIILPGYRFRIDVPIDQVSDIEPFGRFGNTSAKLYPVFDKDVQLDHRYQNTFFEVGKKLISYRNDRLSVSNSSFWQRQILKRRLKKELSKQNKIKELEEWKKEWRWKDEISRLKLQDKVAFVSARSDGKLLPNIRLVYEQVKSPKEIFSKMGGLSEEDMETAIRTVYTSKVVVTDDYFYLFRKFGKKPGQKIVQLWHAAGAFKRFGQDGTELFPTVDQRYHRAYDLVTTSSEEVCDVYARAFGISEDRVKALGVPRTDLLMDKNHRNDVTERFFNKYPKLKDKKILLYAPTFRNSKGQNKNIFNPVMDFDDLHKALGEDQILIVSLHPVMKNRIPEKEYDNIMQVEEFNTNDLMFIADVLITDYSSVIFEYSLLKKPMVFYCYDYGEYNRDFYLDYEKDLPGDLCRTYEELRECIKSKSYRSDDRLLNFQRRYMSACDGESSKRIAEIIDGWID